MVFKVFVDTNMYLDVLMHRGGNWQSGETILRLAERGKIKLYTSSSSLLNIIYILKAQKINRDILIDSAKRILRFSTLINPDNITFEIALDAGFNDLEDAVQYYTALEMNSLDYFITANLKDYKNQIHALPVVSSDVFISTYDKTV